MNVPTIIHKDPITRGAGVAFLLILILHVWVQKACFGQSATYVYTANVYGYDVSGFPVNLASQTLTPVPGSPFPTGNGSPGVIVVDPTSSFLYISTANSISAFNIDPANGALTPVPGSPFAADGVFFNIAIDSTGHYIYGLAFGLQSRIVAYSIGLQGALVPVSGSPFALSETAYQTPFSMVAHPKQPFLYVLSCCYPSKVDLFTIDPATGRLSTTPTTMAQAEYKSVVTYPNENEIVIDPNGHFVYFLGSVPKGQVWVGGVYGYTLDPVAGVLTAMPGSPFSMNVALVSGVVSPNSHYLYLGTHGPSHIMALTIDSATGALGPSSILAPTGNDPAGIAIDPNGFLFATDYNITSQDLWMYSVNALTGGLASVLGSPFSAGTFPAGIAVVQMKPSSTLKVFPAKGGNSGNVTVDVYGTGFQNGAQLNLSAPGQPNVIASSIGVFSDSYLTATFDLTGVPPGNYTLALTNSNGTVMLSDQGAFTIEQGGAPDVWVDLVGWRNLRAGVQQTYYILVGNRGNIDSPIGESAWLSFPSFFSFNSWPNQAPSGAFQAGSTTVLFFQLAAAIPAGAAITIPVTFTVPDLSQYAHQLFQVEAWLGSH